VRDEVVLTQGQFRDGTEGSKVTGVSRKPFYAGVTEVYAQASYRNSGRAQGRGGDAEVNERSARPPRWEMGRREAFCAWHRPG